MLTWFRKHIFSDLRPYMCISEECSEAEKSFASKREWITHQNSHNLFNKSELDVETCPFCLKKFTSHQAKLYSHVCHHMEDIRLLSLPPSHRQLEDPEVFGNSSDTEASDYVPSTPRGELSVVIEEPSTRNTPIHSLKQRLKALGLPDKGKLVGDWLSGENVHQV